MARGDAHEPMLTPAQVAERYKCDVKTVGRWAKEGKLDSIRTPGGHRRYYERQVEALMRGEKWEPPAARAA
jgi:excisionase family DNA binding protein